MALLQTVISENGIVVVDKRNVSINCLIPFTAETDKIIKVQVWDDECDAVIVSETLNTWFTQALGISCKLVFMPDDSLRKVDGRYAANDEITSTAWTFAACAENAVGRGVGGSLPFVKTSLQSAAASSTSFRAILLATVRRATRILSAVEFGAIDGVPLVRKQFMLLSLVQCVFTEALTLWLIFVVGG